MTTARDLRSWLMSAPRPTLVRLQLADGQMQEVECSQPWARLGETCAAMDAVTIWALSAQGKVLRVAKVADIAEDLEPDEQPCSSTATNASAAAVIQKDDSRAMLAVLDKFGTLLASAYQHATSIAFDKMVEVVSLQSQANVAMQRELINARVEVRRMERDIIDDALEKADAAGEGDMLRQFVGSYFAGQAERFAAQATTAVAGAGAAAAPKPNGKPQQAPAPKGSA
jgi:hypothetical protein